MNRVVNNWISLGVSVSIMFGGAAFSYLAGFFLPGAIISAIAATSSLGVCLTVGNFDQLFWETGGDDLSEQEVDLLIHLLSSLRELLVLLLDALRSEADLCSV